MSSILYILEKFGISFVLSPILPSSQAMLDILLVAALVGVIVFPLWVGYQIGVWNKGRIKISREEAREIALKYLPTIYGNVEDARIDTSVIQDFQKEQLVNGEWRIPIFAKAFKQSFRALIVIDARTGKVKGHTLIE